MATKIILLSDGTGNSAAKVWRTNVWRMFESLDLSGSEQRAFYDDGVGSALFKPFAVVAGAFGYGLKRNVIDLYKFVCRNYQSDEDEIFGFGFSRGAFTIKIVIGLILHEGLVNFDSEADLHHKARAAYRAYRNARFHTITKYENILRRIRDFIFRSHYDRSKNRMVPHIRFIGLWDTVAAYGLPVDEMTRGVSDWLWPLELPDRTLSEKVMRACHALSLDDDRTTFRPILWTERGEASAKPDERGQYITSNERISQVWFAGVHSNVGGGYPDDSLAYLSLYWMMQEAQFCGLKFKSGSSAEPDAIKRALCAQDKDGRLYATRRGFGTYYRYGPRKLDELCHARGRFRSDEEVDIDVPKIHESVLQRLQVHAHPYAPVGIPEKYSVVTYNGRILPPEENPYETPEHAKARCKIQGSVWNLVWVRRLTYFANTFFMILLIGFPIISPLVPIFSLDRSLLANRRVSSFLDFTGDMLPSILQFWTSSYAKSPSILLALIVLTVSFTLINRWLETRITDHMRVAWDPTSVHPQNVLVSLNWIGRLRARPASQSFWYFARELAAPFVFAFLIGVTAIYFTIALSNNIALTFWDGQGCRNSDNTTALKLKKRDPSKPDQPQDSFSFVFHTSNDCQASAAQLDKDTEYQIKIAITDAWRDDGLIDAGVQGFGLTNVESLGHRIWLYFMTPFRRAMTLPWFNPIIRIKAAEGQLAIISFEKAACGLNAKDLFVGTITPEQSGELFFYVNDVFFVPLHEHFYKKNTGRATITVTPYESGKPPLPCT